METLISFLTLRYITQLEGRRYTHRPLGPRAKADKTDCEADSVLQKEIVKIVFIQTWNVDEGEDRKEKIQLKCFHTLCFQLIFLVSLVSTILILKKTVPLLL